MPSSRGSSWPRNRTHISYVSCISRWGSLPLAPPGKPQGHLLQPNSKKVQFHSVSQESQSLPRGFDEALTPAPLSLLWTSEAKPISPPVNSQPSISTIHPWPFVDSAFYTSAEKPGFLPNQVHKTSTVTPNQWILPSPSSARMASCMLNSTLLILIQTHLEHNFCPQERQHHCSTWEQSLTSDRAVCSVTQSCLTLATPRTVACQAPLSIEFCRQEYWSRLPFPPPGDLPNPGTEPRSPTMQADSLPVELPGKPQLYPSEVVSNKSGLSLPLQTQHGKKNWENYQR